MKVFKFGGTSVQNSAAVKQIEKIISSISSSESVIVVVSALSGATDTLLRCAQQASQGYLSYREEIEHLMKRHHVMVDELILDSKKGESHQFLAQKWEEISALLDSIYHLNEVSTRSLDKIVSYGELMSSFIIAHALLGIRSKVVWSDSRTFIKTDDFYGKAIVDTKSTYTLCQSFFKENEGVLYVAPGFIASDGAGHTTTLGRGGSDYTAALIGAALRVEEVVIWTDVNGVYSANPSIVNEAFCLPELQYEEAMELAHFGAKVLYPPTIQPLYDTKAILYIKNTFEPEHSGTKITASPKQDTTHPITGITYRDKLVLLTIEGSGMVGVSGMAQRIFGALAKEKINIVFITQASSEHSICIGIDSSDQELAQKALHRELSFEFENQRIKPLQWETQVALVAVVGNQMKDQPGLSGRLFRVLGKNNINVRAIAQGASERNISCVISLKDAKKAVKVLHETFFEQHLKTLNLIVFGMGNVGEKFLNLLQRQKTYLRQERNLKVNVVALANSTKIIVDENGISLDNFKDNLVQKGQLHRLSDVNELIQKLNIQNLVFVDNTASDEVAQIYPTFLQNKVAVVTCNKIANASSMAYYNALKTYVKKQSTPFLYETNVGAGLPIIDTIKNLITTGDKVHKIKAVLSGSLNFIFNHYKAETPFSDIVKQAQMEGYTEPDPRLDLSGGDVIRKIIILIRECGYVFESHEVENRIFLDDASNSVESIGDFYASLSENEDFYANLYHHANQKGCKLKFVATFDYGKASVGLEEIPFDHPFYNLEGKDNIVLFYTDRYSEQPLLIKGAGAGAEVTASGIFADVLRLSTI